MRGCPAPAARCVTVTSGIGGSRRLWTADYRGRTLTYGAATHVMGILNVTADSFSDGGQYLVKEKALDRARTMVAEGAAIVDVGAESAGLAATRPSLDAELARLLPIIDGLRELPVLISVDTYKARVADAVLAAGAHIINDIGGLRTDDDMATVIAAHGAGVVIMHSLGVPPTLSSDPHYDDVVGEVCHRLSDGVQRALTAGIHPTRIIVDPGIGVGKRTEHNLALLRSLAAIAHLGFPVLLGASRTSVIGNVLRAPISARDVGTLATTALAVAQGADLVRVHAVGPNVQVACMADAIVRGIEPPPDGWPYDEVTGAAR